MPRTSYGIVVEGTYDAPFYEELIRRISSPDVEIISRETGGITRFNRIFPAILRDLEHMRGGAPVDKALVVQDSDGRNPASVEQEMQDRNES